MRPTLRARTVGLLLGAVLPAAGCHGFDLLDAYALAAANDPSFQAASASHAAGQEHRAIGRAGLLPQLNMNYQNAPRNQQDVTYTLANGERSGMTRDYSSYAGNVTFTQTLFDVAAWARWKQGGAMALMAQEQFRAKAQDLLLRVAKAYTDTLYATEQLALVRAQRDTYAEQLQRNTQAFRHGDGTRTDIAETESRLKLSEVDLIDAQDRLDAARRTLEAITGAAPQDLERLMPLRSDFIRTVAPSLTIAGFDRWRELAEASNADLAALRHSLEASRQEARRLDAAHLPVVRLFAQYAQNQSEIAATYNQQYRTATVGITVNLPIYSGGGASAAARQAAYQLASAEQTLRAQTNEVLLELRRQYRAAASGPERIAAGQSAVDAAATALAGSQRGVAVGERINLDVLTATQQWFTARRDLARASYDVLNARLALRYRAGVLGEADLQEMAGFFSSSTLSPVPDGSSFADGTYPPARN